MRAPTRVLVIAKNDRDAGKLARIFSSSAGFVVESAIALAQAKANAVAADVVVAQVPTKNQAAFPQLTGPILFLVPRGDFGILENATTSSVLPADATREQIRAAALAVASGLHVGPIDARQPPRNYESDFALQEPLTEREIHVLNLIADGFSNPEIGKRLGISRNTVKFHVSSVISKLGAASRTEAVTVGVKRGLIIL